MQVAVITSTPDVQLSEEGDFYFVLAQRVREDIAYRNFFTNFRDRLKFVLLDNGAFELTKSLRTDLLLDIAKEIDTNEIVAPDYPMHGIESYKMLIDFISVCPKKYRIVALPHGKNVEEFVHYYKLVAKQPEVSVIGLSVLFQKATGLRPHVYQYLKKCNLFAESTHHHLFGLDALTELWCYSSNDIRSVDCSLPVSLAWCNQDLDEIEPPQKHLRIPEDAKLDSIQRRMALDNIGVYRRVARKV